MAATTTTTTSDPSSSATPMSCRNIAKTVRGLSDAAATLRITSIRSLAPNTYYPSRYSLDSSSRRALSTTTSTSPSYTPNLILPLSSISILNPQKSVIFRVAPGAGPSITNRALSDTTTADEDVSDSSSTSSAADSLPKKFTYEIAASYAAKQRRWEAANTFVYSPYNRIPYEPNWQARKRARPKTGQDAFFVSRIKDTGAVAFGVADGVGGYSDSGIDSADFSHTFCEDMAEIAHQADAPMSAGKLMSQGYQRVTSNKNVPGGASTACVAVAKANGHLEVANLGDSGYVILRCGRVHYSSPPQTHAFNTPFQLSVVPQELIDQALKYGGGVPLSDQPEDADLKHHILQHGDVLIFATDGLWDNLSAQEVLRLAAEEMVNAKGWALTENGFVPGVNLPAITGLQAAVARAVASRAKIMSLNKKVDGPFAKEVQRVFPGETYHGGKNDDICVVCAIAIEESTDDVYIRGGLPGGGGPGAPMPRL